MSDGTDDAEVYRADGGFRHMAGSGYSDRFAESWEDLDDSDRLWWCPNCGAVFDRDHRTQTYKFCNNCESRDAVLIECKPVGPGSDGVKT